MVKNLPTMQETWVQSQGWEDPLEKGMATHSSILAWNIPWSRKEPDTTEWLTPALFWIHKMKIYFFHLLLKGTDKMKIGIASLCSQLHGNSVSVNPSFRKLHLILDGRTGSRYSLAWTKGVDSLGRIVGVLPIGHSCSLLWDQSHPKWFL